MYFEFIPSSNEFAGSSTNRLDSPTFSPPVSVSQAMDLSYDATFTDFNNDLHHFNDPQASFGSSPSIPEA
jgi:hypothetical protein